MALKLAEVGLSVEPIMRLISYFKMSFFIVLFKSDIVRRDGGVNLDALTVNERNLDFQIRTALFRSY